MDIAVLGVNFKTNSLACREEWNVPTERRDVFLKAICALRGVQGVVYLPTCHRVEVYATVTPNFSPATLENHWRDFLGLKPAHRVGYFYKNREAIQHLLRVACGLDSMVLGETEVFGQVKQAYQEALQQKRTDGLLNFLFQRVFQIAKQVRTETGLSRYPISISSIGLMLLEQVFGAFGDLKALCLGLGEMGTQTAQALVKRGVRKLWLANRNEPKAVEWSKRLGSTAQAVAWSELDTLFPQVDIVIAATAAPQFVLSLEQMKSQAPLKVLLDLGVPRNIDPAIGKQENVFLYNVDDLQTIANKNLVNRQQEAALAEKLIRKEMGQLEVGWQQRDVDGRVAQLVRVLP